MVQVLGKRERERRHVVTSKILNPERLKKIKGNREKLASRLTC